MSTISEQKRYHTVFIVSIINAIINLLLAILKIVFGITGHSQALVADGIHSFSDLITDGLVLVAARMGSQLPDKEHPYGHRRIETIGSIIIAVILIIVAVIIGYDTTDHLILSLASPKPSLTVVIVALVSIVANEGLFWYGLLQGKRIQSDLLRSNAWHNRSDAFTSIVVLVAAGGDLLGVHYLDSVGAIIIALIILWMGVKIAWRCFSELIDASVDDKTLSKIQQQISKVDGVKAVHQLRTRMHGDNIFIDVHIQVDSFISVSEGHFIGDQVHLTLNNNIDNITDVTVHIDAEDDEIQMPSVNLPTRKQLDELLATHLSQLPGYSSIIRKTLHYIDGKLIVELHFPLFLLRTQSDIKQFEQLYNNVVRPITTIHKLTLLFQ